MVTIAGSASEKVHALASMTMCTPASVVVLVPVQPGAPLVDEELDEDEVDDADDEDDEDADPDEEVDVDADEELDDGFEKVAEPPVPEAELPQPVPAPRARRTK
jgi:hypothetical protein